MALPIDGLKLTDVILFINDKHGVSYTKLSEVNSKFDAVQADNTYYSPPIDSLGDWRNYSTGVSIPTTPVLTYSHVPGKEHFTLDWTVSNVDPSTTLKEYEIDVDGERVGAGVGTYFIPAGTLILDVDKAIREWISYGLKIRGRDNLGQVSPWSTVIDRTPTLQVPYLSTLYGNANIFDETRAPLSSVYVSLYFTADGDKLVYSVDRNGSYVDVFIYQLQNNWDITGIVLDIWDYRIENRLSGLTNHNQTLFSNNGQYAFVIPYTTATVKRLNITEGGWAADMRLTSGSGKSLNLANFTTDVGQVAFSPDGMKFMFLEGNGTAIHQLNLSSAWDWNDGYKPTSMNKTIPVSDFSLDGYTALEIFGFHFVGGGTGFLVPIKTNIVGEHLLCYAQLSTPYDLTSYNSINNITYDYVTDSLSLLFANGIYTVVPDTTDRKLYPLYLNKVSSDAVYINDSKIL